MKDDMGINKSMPEELAPKIIDGLKKHTAYLGFFVCIDGQYAALANCNLNFSTWKAKPLINIHDFIVSPKYRKQGVGQFLLSEIERYAQQNGYCKINLEVRNDNYKAQNLYKKAGFTNCEPPMYYWQKII
ncbi:MAG: GNAT family N-acetyltransferase [Mangrovibacterium sp.]